MAGRKPKLTAAAVKRAISLKEHGALNQDIAAALGVTEGTFYGWIQLEDSEGNPLTKKPLESELAEGLKRAEADYKNALLDSIKLAGEKDWKANAWLLERKYPAHFARTDRIQAEVNAKHGGGVTVTHAFDYGEQGADD